MVCPHAVNYPSLTEGASCFIMSMLRLLGQALIPAVPAVLPLLSITIADTWSLPDTRPHFGQLCILIESFLGTEQPQIHTCDVPFGGSQELWRFYLFAIAQSQ